MKKIIVMLVNIAVALGLIAGTFWFTMDNIKVYPSNTDDFVMVESCGQTWACDFITEK
jgi:hypothetical protein